MRCNCENINCPHGEKSCPNDAGKKRVMYLGAVCDECYENMLPEYRLPKKTYTVVVGNVGTVHDGWDRQEAEDAFDEYVGQSKSGLGYGGKEDVALFEDEEVLAEYMAPRRGDRPVDPWRKKR